MPNKVLHPTNIQKFIAKEDEIYSLAYKYIEEDMALLAKRMASTQETNEHPKEDNQYMAKQG